MGDVAAEMTVQAALNGDHERLAVLAAIGEELVRQAAALAAGRDDAEHRVSIASRCAAMLRPKNTRPRQS